MTAPIIRFLRPRVFLIVGFLLCGMVTPALAQQDGRLAPATPSLTAPAETLLPESAPNIAAQEGPSTKDLNLGSGVQKKPPSTSIDPADIPDILMQEMKEIETSCLANYFYSSFHDCRCVAVKFLDARIKNEPGASRDTVYKSVASQCADKVAVAGFVYRSCYDFMKFQRPYDYREFCSCSANHMAEEYAAYPMVNLRYMEKLRKNAYMACGLANAPEWRAMQR